MGIEHSCTKVWNELLTKQNSMSSNKEPAIGIAPSNFNSTQYEITLAQLQEDQRLTGLKVQTHSELLKEYYDLIQEWIIPTLELLCSEKASQKPPGNCTAHVENLLQRFEKSSEIYKKL